MGLFKRLTGQASTSAQAEEPPIEMPRKKSSFEISRKKSSFVVPSSEPVTEASLKVFRALPQTIRHDPSMISFQQEHERCKGRRKFHLLACRRHHRCFSQHPHWFCPFLSFIDYSSLLLICIRWVGNSIPFHYTILTFPPLLSPLRDGISAEEAAHHSGTPGIGLFSKAHSVDEVENDDSDSEGGEFITIKVTNEEGKTEAEEVDHIEKHKAR